MSCAGQHVAGKVMARVWVMCGGHGYCDGSNVEPSGSRWRQKDYGDECGEDDDNDNDDWERAGNPPTTRGFFESFFLCA